MFILKILTLYLFDKNYILKKKLYNILYPITNNRYIKNLKMILCNLDFIYKSFNSSSDNKMSKNRK